MSALPSVPRTLTKKKERPLPKFRVHKATGQGYVVLNKHPFYLGRADDPKTLVLYHQKVAEWLAAGRQFPQPPDEITVKEIVARFYVFARDYYRRADGKPSGEIENFRNALRPLHALYGESKAIEFSPLALKAVRQRMIDRGLCRNTVNKNISRVKLLFRWATENELLPPQVYHGLQAVAGLKRGRCGARESEPVRPVPLPYVEAIRPFVSRQVWALVQLQLLTAARAGELVNIRPCDIDTSGRVWIYNPLEHKTAHHGHERFIYMGPRAQAIIKPFLARPTDAYLFSPAEAEEERLAALHVKRKTPLSCGNRPGTHRRSKPKHKPGNVYDVAAYRRAIARACDIAFPPPEPLVKGSDETLTQWRARLTPEQKKELNAWQSNHRWHPHQLRHNAATELRKEFGLDAARAILGHRSPAITDLYAEIDHDKAVDAMLRVG